MYPLVPIDAPEPLPLSDGDVAFPVRLVLPIVVSLDVYLGHLTFLHLCSRIDAVNLFSSAGVCEPPEDVVDIASLLLKGSFCYQVTADVLSEFEQRADQSSERVAARHQLAFTILRFEKRARAALTSVTRRVAGYKYQQAVHPCVNLSPDLLCFGRAFAESVVAETKANWAGKCSLVIESMSNSIRTEAKNVKHSIDSFIKLHCVDKCKDCFNLPYTSYDPSVGTECVAEILALNVAHGAAICRQEDAAMALALYLASPA